MYPFRIWMCSRYQEGLSEDKVALVIHMTPESVLRDSRYQQWLERCVVFWLLGFTSLLDSSVFRCCKDFPRVGVGWQQSSVSDEIFSNWLRCVHMPVWGWSCCIFCHPLIDLDLELSTWCSMRTALRCTMRAATRSKASWTSSTQRSSLCSPHTRAR